MNERIIGNYSSNKKGPLVFITAGVHGNEPSGVQALERVFEQLEKTQPKIKGRIIGLRGNLSALKEGKRFLDEDLNRTWKKETISKGEPQTQEQKELFEIIKILEEHPEEDYTKRYFLDCHTTSSETLPYMSVQDINDNDEWAHRFPTYIVRGFSDIVYGAIDHYLSRTGLTGFVFEAGQHESEVAVENHEGIIWLVLEEACVLDLTQIETYPECVEQFTERNSPDQKTFDIIHRHEIKNGEDFKMQPGYKNFQEIEKGELLAISNGEEIRSEWNARIFMPLYQSQGNDGFFIIDEQ